MYVDEIQDSTQAEIFLFFLAAGMNFDGMFLSGDPAQSVVEGVGFRFEEVRSIVYNLSQTNCTISKPQVLETNFRSHQGILKCANCIIDLMFSLFESTGQLPLDQGLCNGPRPTFLFDDVTGDGSDSRVKAMLEKNQKIVVLCRDDNFNDPEECSEPKTWLNNIIPNTTFLLGMRASKGMEFSDVLIINFFCDLPVADQRWWGKCFRSTLDKSASSFQAEKMHYQKMKGDEYPQMETQLKLLYTAITRCCNRLIFVETKKCEASLAFFGWLKENGLADESVFSDSDTAEYLSPDEWRVRGIEMIMNSGDEIAFLKQGIKSLIQAGASAKSLVSKAELQAEALHECNSFNKRMKESQSRERVMDLATERKMAGLIAKCLEGGLLEVANDVIQQITDCFVGGSARGRLFTTRVNVMMLKVMGDQ